MLTVHGFISWKIISLNC